MVVALVSNRKIGFGLIIGAALVSFHQWLAHRDWFELHDVMNHEVWIVVMLVLGITFILKDD